MIGRALTTRTPHRPRVGAETWWPVDRSGTVGSHAGVPVSEERSLTLPAVFCAIDLAASHMAMLPCPVIQRTGPQTTERHPEHPIHGLINRSPNPEQTSFSWRRSWHLHTVLWGNGRVEIERTGNGSPRNLWPLLPDRTVTIRRERSKDLAYRVTRDGGLQQIIGADNVLHVAGLSYEGIDGYGLIRHLARENMGLGLAIAKYAQSFFGNNTMLGAVLSSKEVLDAEVKKQHLEQWEEAQKGPGKAFKAVFMDGDVKVGHIGRTNEESQTVEQLTYAIQDVSRWTGIPPPLLMDLSRGTFTNITELGLWYVKFFLAKWFKPYEQEITRKLFTGQELDDGYYVEYVAEGLLRGDIGRRYGAYAIGLDRGFLNRDEVRHWENLNPLPDGKGQVFMEQLNTAPAGSRETLPGPAEPRESSSSSATIARQRIADAHEPVFAATLERMDKIETTGLSRAAKAVDKRQWSERFYAGHTAKLRDAMSPLVDAMAAALRGTMPAGTDADWQRFVESFTWNTCEAHIATRQAGEVEPGNMSQRLLAEALEEFDNE